MSDPLEPELPSVYLDAGLEDALPAVIAETPVLINLDPEPDETRIRALTDIQFDIATTAPAGAIDHASIQVFVNGVPAVVNGVFQAGFNGPDSSLTDVFPDTTRVIIDRTTIYDSEELVSVHVVAFALGHPTDILDTTYSFTIEDYAPPQLLSAVAHDLQHVLLTFNEHITENTAGDPTSALTPANYTLQRLGDYLHPIVSAKVVGAVVVTTTSVEVETDIPLTPGGAYRIIATAVEDVSGNAIIAPNNVAEFTGWVPPVPMGREFDLYKKLPLLNRQEDDTQDLFRFIACLQEVITLLLWDIDRYIDILDPDTAPEAVVDLMLQDLGNPFSFDLSLADKRRLAQILVDIYKLKGTNIGIVSVIRFFMGLEVTIDTFNASSSTWVLGDSELGVGSILGTTDSGLLYSFTVTVGQALTVTQRRQLRSIVEYMKPAHTHFVRLIEPAIPLILDHLELGLSELGENWFLH